MSNYSRIKRKPPFLQYAILLSILVWMIAMTVTVVALCIDSFAEEVQPSISYEEESMEESTCDVPRYTTEDIKYSCNEVEQEEEVEVPEHKETTFFLSDSERYIVEQVVMSECGNEPYEGIVAVAQCIYNTAVNKGMSPADVVQVPGQYASMSSKEANDNVKKAVSQVFDSEEFYVEEPIMFFYAPKYSAGTWHESSPNLEYVCTIGGHKFFKLKGA